MSDNKASLSLINTTLTTIFNVKDWSYTQSETYKLMKQFVDSFKENYRVHETRDDKVIIRNNFKEQTWFICSKSKPIISHLLDNMKLTSYMYDANEYCINFNVVLSFDHFQLNGHLYKNFTNNLINYYILVENKKHQKAYLTFYVNAIGNDINTKNLKLPEFNQIYEIINISQNIFYQCDLINFFAEIIMYYDESQLIGDIPIGNNISVTLNQLTEKFNSYILKKKNENDYNIVTH
jgi:hypothetical protein